MEHILSSGFARGEKLPSESDLVRRFDVSRVTVRQALEALRAEGFIESRHGKGWFLRRICAVQNLGELQGFGEMLAPMGVKVRSKVLDIKECAHPESGGEGVRPAGTRNVIQIARLRIAGGRVMSYDLSYFPLDIGRRLREQDLSRQDIFVLLERALGMPLGFADVTIEIAPADDEPAQQLGVKLATPIFKMTRLTHDLSRLPDRLRIRLRSARNRICSRSGCRADDGDRPAPRCCRCWQRRCCRRVAAVGRRSSARRAARQRGRRPSSHCPILPARCGACPNFAGGRCWSNFWAVWCPPCRRELAELADLRRTLADDAVRNSGHQSRRQRRAHHGISCQLPGARSADPARCRQDRGHALACRRPSRRLCGSTGPASCGSARSANATGARRRSNANCARWRPLDAAEQFSSPRRVVGRFARQNEIF